MKSWPIVGIEECCRVVSGATPDTNNPTLWNGQIPWATPKDLSDLDGTYLRDTPRKITQEGLDSCAAELLPVGSVLFSSRAPIGHTAINTIPLATNQGFKSFVPYPNRLDALYLYYWLRANRSMLEALGNGATFKEVSKAVISRVRLPLPPLPEQRRIAAILDHADALRARRRAAIAKLDSLTQSSFVETFCGTDSARWSKAPLSELASSIRTGPFGSQLLHSEFVESGVAVLGIDNVVQNSFTWAKPRFITERKFQSLKRYAVSPGDVLITIMATCGRCAIVPNNIGRAINTKHICCISLDPGKCKPSYLHACFLRHPDILRQLGVSERGAVMPGLNMQLIKELLIPLPPLTTQHRWKARVEKITLQSAKQAESLSGLDALFASLQHRAFRGELDPRNKLKP